METTFCFKSMSNGTINDNNSNSNSNNKNNKNAIAQPAKAAYTCLCNFGYYVPNQTLQGFEGHVIESGDGNGNYSCIRCPGACSHCDENGACSIGEAQEFVSLETLVRFGIGVVLGACMLCCLVLAAIVFRQRKCKVCPVCPPMMAEWTQTHDKLMNWNWILQTISTGMWTVLEIILLGVLLMYASVSNFSTHSTLSLASTCPIDTLN